MYDRHISRQEIADLSTLDALRLRSTDSKKRNSLPSNGDKFLPSLSQLDEFLGTDHVPIHLISLLFSPSPEAAATMISSKKLINMAKKWQKFVIIRRKRISFPKQNEEEVDSCSTSSAVNKGHFVIYTADQKRFVIPLSFLDNKIIRQLLEMSEEEFGLPSNGPITLPCDAVLMKYIISLLSRGVSTQLQNALLVSVTSNRCSSASLHQGWRNQPFLLC
nr:auxin-responsive protein SAUR68-like [Ipomoea batatas]